MKKILVAASMMLLGSSGAWALGTVAGITINNGAELSYTVGGVDYTKPTDTDDTFVVDRKIDMVLQTTDGTQVEVTPEQINAITSYTFKNEGNHVQQFHFTAKDLASSDPVNGEADYNDLDDSDKTLTNIQIKCIEADGTEHDWATDLTFDLGITVGTDDTATCEVRATIPAAGTAAGEVSDEDVLNVELEVVAYKDDASGPMTETNVGVTDDKDFEDVVFADGSTVQNTSDSTGLGDSYPAEIPGHVGTADGHKGDGTVPDGKEVARSGYIVKFPILTVVKTSCVISDPVLGASANAKRIPGAIIRFMFDIANNGTADATGITLKDNKTGSTMNDAFLLSDDITKNNAKISGDEESSCACTSPGATDKSADTTYNNTVGSKEVTITNIGVKAKSGGTASHVCVSFEVELD